MYLVLVYIIIAFIYIMFPNTSNKKHNAQALIEGNTLESYNYLEFHIYNGQFFLYFHLIYAKHFYMNFFVIVS